MCTVAYCLLESASAKRPIFNTVTVGQIYTTKWSKYKHFVDLVWNRSYLRDTHEITPVINFNTDTTSHVINNSATSNLCGSYLPATHKVGSLAIRIAIQEPKRFRCHYIT